MPVTEAHYPVTFREETAKELGEQLRRRRSVNLVGMKRIGISNFLRFFLYHKDIVPTYISTTEQHLFIPVDLNDLVERELFPFWALTLKRIVDASATADLAQPVKQKIEALFLSGIQSQDLFLLVENVRQALITMVESGVLPTIFFLRFDRIKDTINPAFFDNLMGLREATHQRVAFVFTSYRSLDVLAPSVFPKTSLSVFSHLTYLSRASGEDMDIIYETMRRHTNFALSQVLEQALFEIVGGHVQYLQLALILLQERKDHEVQNKEELFEILVKDERLLMQSEELWESLEPEEQTVLMKLYQTGELSDEDKQTAPYLWSAGFIQLLGEKEMLFSPLLPAYLSQKREIVKEEDKNIHFSRKEHLLFQLLEDRLGEVCERDEIIESVWPEYREMGVSDWAIDRLVARVRSKLKQQQSSFEIKTIRTRGYQLVARQ